MPSRDEELEALQRELTRPFLEKPDEINVEVGGACFLNASRVCGPDCTSFTTELAPTAQERCTLLSCVQNVSEALIEIAHLLKPKKPSLGASDIRPPYDTRPR